MRTTRGPKALPAANPYDWRTRLRGQVPENVQTRIPSRERAKERLNCVRFRIKHSRRRDELGSRRFELREACRVSDVRVVRAQGRDAVPLRAVCDLFAHDRVLRGCGSTGGGQSPGTYPVHQVASQSPAPALFFSWHRSVRQVDLRPAPTSSFTCIQCRITNLHCMLASESDGHSLLLWWRDHDRSCTTHMCSHQMNEWAVNPMIVIKHRSLL